MCTSVFLCRILAFLALVVVHPLQAREDASQIVTQKVIRIFHHIQTVQKDPSQAQILADELVRSVDYQDVVRRIMDTEWETLTEAQKKRARELIDFYVKEAILPAVNKINAEKINIQRVKGKGAHYLVISSVEDSFGDRMGVAWQIRYDTPHAKILDVMVGGVSAFDGFYSEMNYLFVEHREDVDAFLDYIETFYESNP